MRHRDPNINLSTQRNGDEDRHMADATRCSQKLWNMETAEPGHGCYNTETHSSTRGRTTERKTEGRAHHCVYVSCGDGDHDTRERDPCKHKAPTTNNCASTTRCETCATGAALWGCLTAPCTHRLTSNMYACVPLATSDHISARTHLDWFLLCSTLLATSNFNGSLTRKPTQLTKT